MNNELTLGDLRDAIRRYWKACLAAGLLGAALGGVAGWLRPKSFVAIASFIPEQEKTIPNLPSGLGALAAQFGLDVAGEPGRSPPFYRDLLTTSGLLSSVLDTMVALDTTDSVSVRRLFAATSDTSRKGTTRVLRILRKRVGTYVDTRTSIVTLTVRTRTPNAAEATASVLIRAVKRFNVATRQTQAHERRIFLEQRVVEAYDSLQAAEGRLRGFYMSNRRITDSPSLQFEESRLKRQIDLQQDLYTSLSKELEQSRIQEVNDTPTITVVDPPFASSRPAGPTVLLLVALGFMLGALVEGGWLVLRTIPH